jgi:hypothetical protein
MTASRRPDPRSAWNRAGARPPSPCGGGGVVMPLRVRASSAGRWTWWDRFEMLEQSARPPRSRSRAGRSGLEEESRPAEEPASRHPWRPARPPPRPGGLNHERLELAHYVAEQRSAQVHQRVGDHRGWMSHRRSRHPVRLPASLRDCWHATVVRGDPLLGHEIVPGSLPLLIEPSTPCGLDRGCCSWPQGSSAQLVGSTEAPVTTETGRGARATRCQRP